MAVIVGVQINGQTVTFHPTTSLTTITGQIRTLFSYIKQTITGQLITYSPVDFSSRVFSREIVSVFNQT